MQPEPSKVLQNAILEQSISDNAPTSSQHGIHPDDQPASLLPHEEERRVSGALFGDDTVAEASSPERVAATSNDATRLSQPSPSGRTRIEEYENATAQSTRKRSDGPVFEVIKKNRKPDDESSPIVKLPNG